MGLIWGFQGFSRRWVQGDRGPPNIPRLAAGDEAEEGKTPAASEAGKPPTPTLLSLVLGLHTGPR